VKALLVGQDDASYEVLASVLRDRLHEVVQAADADVAWEASQAGLPAFVFLPSPVDAALLARLRALPVGDQIVVFAVVAADRPDDWSAALAAGANDYIPRPVDPRLLEWRLAIAERQSGAIRRQRRVEDTLLKLEKAVATMQLGVTLSDLDGRIVFVNPAEAGRHGYGVDELVGQSVRIFSAGPVAARTPEGLSRIGRWSRERWSRRKDGALIPVRLLSDLLTDKNGQPIGVVTTCEDITERRRAEEALRDSELRYRSLVDNASDLIATAASDGSITTLNPEFERMTGFPREAWVGKPFAPLVHPADLERTMDSFHRALAGERIPLAEVRLLTSSGRYIEAEYTAAPQLDGSDVCGVLAILRDLTARKRSERLDAMRSSVTQLLSQTASLGEAVPALLELVSRTLEWPVAEYWRTAAGPLGGSSSPALQYLHVAAGSDLRLATYGSRVREMSAAPGVGLPARVLVGGEALWVRDVARDPDFPRAALARDAGLGGAVAFPVTAGGEVHGVVVLIAAQTRELDPELFRVLLDVGRQLGNFIRRASAEAALRASEERFSLAVLGANDGIWDWNFATGEAFFSTRWKQLLGYAESDVGATPEEWFSRVQPEDRDRLIAQISAHLQGASPFLVSEYRMRHRDGGYRWVLTRGAAVRDESNTLCRMAGSQTDVTDRRGYDALTLLPNRSLFLERLELAVARARQNPDYGYAVLFLDLDRFKEANDTLGHLAGDQLLVGAARRLEESVRPGDTVARFGGDEFTVLLDRILGAADAVMVAERIEEKLNTPLAVAGTQLRISASIGIALGSTRQSRAEEVLAEADAAMYRAKSSGRGRFEVAGAPRERLVEGTRA